MEFIKTIYLYVFGILMLLGGIYGYKKSGSKISLIMGIASSVCVFFGLFVAQTNAFLGLSIVLVVSAVLIGAFAKRLFKTKKFMPSGMLLILSVGALLASLCLLMAG